MVWGDNIEKSATYRARLAECRRFVEIVNKYGGQAEVLVLPEAGLKGNTHLPFADLNNVAVADLLSKFLAITGSIGVDRGAETRSIPTACRRRAVTGPCATTMMVIAMCVLDSTSSARRLPSIARDFHASAATSIWIVNSYQIVDPHRDSSHWRRWGDRWLAGGSPRQASLSHDRFTPACAFAHTLLELTIARAIQGIGAAGIMSVNAALVRFTYPARTLGRAIGINATVARRGRGSRPYCGRGGAWRLRTGDGRLPSTSRSASSRR